MILIQIGTQFMEKEKEFVIYKRIGLYIFKV